MNYTLVWAPNAERQLTELWLNAVDRAAVQRASDQIDKTLRTSPRDKGESREGEFRMLLMKPLGVKFRVIEADRIVRVVRVWAF
jgi:plasmid stabilization system protein ParE